MNKYIKLILDPRYRFSVFSSRGFYKKLSDEQFLRKKYKVKMRKEINLENPETFTEKLQWLKLYDRKPIYTQMVDKHGAKQYVADRIGEEHIIPTLGVWKSFDDIDFDSLPNQFVLKCTHDSGGLVICRDKSKLDKNAARAKINRSMKRNYYYLSREWPYKNVEPQIIAEKFMSDEINGSSLMDYKFYCFNGEPKFLYISSGLEDHSTAHISFVTLDWEFAPFHRKDFAPFDVLPEKPTKFDDMLAYCRELSSGHSFLRVDLYQINGEVYFSELTFSPCGGFMPLKETEYDKILGDMLTLPIVDGK